MKETELMQRLRVRVVALETRMDAHDRTLVGMARMLCEWGWGYPGATTGMREDVIERLERWGLHAPAWSTGLDLIAAMGAIASRMAR